jgi:c-di-GMP-related signal transduction protein
MNKCFSLIPGACLALALALLSGCNLEMKDGAREIETLQATNSSLKQELDTKDARLKEQEAVISQLKQELTDSQAEIFAVEQRMIELRNAPPPAPPAADLIYDVGLVTTTGEKMKLRDVTFGKSERHLPTKVEDGRVLFEFASIDTFQRIGRPSDGYMPATLITTDYQEIKVTVLLHHLAGTQSNGRRIEVPLEEINAMRLQQREAPEKEE